MYLSESLFERAKLRIPGGVNSPVRSFQPYPLFISSGRGSKIITCDHQTLIDYCMGYGAVLLGHAYSEVIDLVRLQLDKGTLYCMPTEQEVVFAELLCKTIPNTEMVRIMNTGSEATMHAIRLARSFTGKKKIVKFDGCYHGSYDYVLVNAGSGVAESARVEGNLVESTQNTLLIPYNDLNALEEMVRIHSDIACVIVEPILANMGLIVPKQDFLNRVRTITEENGILLIFDEIVTGFRLSIGGASEYFGIRPDISTFGKAIGNGFPLSVVSGRKDILELLSPKGFVYQGSTYAGNPLSVTAGIATIKILSESKSDIYPRMTRLCDSLANGINDHLEENGLNYQLSHIGSMFQIFFTDGKVENAADARMSNRAQYKNVFNGLLKLGVFIPPSQFETCFISYSHNEEDIDLTIDAYSSALHDVRES
ncbi:MAG: glutamate-1-semialdehyde 2,1-aminomutase [Thermoproteota archaeon]|nr:glutamate-1-semialdehyde 2,1-aminomutase [Thermoproteota archaeon]